MALGNSKQIEIFLEAQESRIHPEWGFPSDSLKSPGYHTRIPDGRLVHSTRSGARYSLALLQTRNPKWTSRFPKVWEAILSFQETDPYKTTYGIWPWFCEEPLPQMAPPDWNWADFIGSQIAHILRDHSAEIPPPLLTRLKRALHHAAWSIFRRNVQPGYTNIALMGAGVAAAAGEMLGEPDLLDYARHRLNTFAEHTRFHGDFNEYNSPTYTMVAIEEVDRMLYLVKDETIRDLAEEIRVHAWKVVGQHFHAPTQTWSGPNSRTYGDSLNPEAKRLFAELAGVDFGSPDKHAGEGGVVGMDFDLFPRLPCPADLKPLFQKSFPTPEELKLRFIRASSEEFSVYGTTYFTSKISLGSVNREMFWTQRRPLIAYWGSGEKRPAVLRLRMIHDGRDFASAMLLTAQDKNRILVSVGFIKNKGDFHPTLDRPAEPIYSCKELVLRWELVSGNAEVEYSGGETGVLKSSGVRAEVRLPAGEVENRNIIWERGQESIQQEGSVFKKVWIEAVIHRGAARTFDLRKLAPTKLATGIEILEANQKATESLFVSNGSGVSWGDLQLPWIQEISDLDHAEKS